MYQVLQVEKNDVKEFRERLFLQQFTQLESFILEIAGMNDLNTRQIAKTLSFLASVHEGLKIIWDPEYFSETYKFTVVGNISPIDATEISMKPMITNIVSEYRSIYKYVAEKGWNVPRMNKSSNKSQNNHGQKSKIHEKDSSKSKSQKSTYGNKKARIRGDCHNCGKPRHCARDCRSAKKSETGKELQLYKAKSFENSSIKFFQGFKKPEVSVKVGDFSESRNVSVDFILDTGSDYHFVNDKAYLDNFRENEANFIGSNGSPLVAEGIGCMALQLSNGVVIRLNEVIYSKDVPANLLSATHLNIYDNVHVRIDCLDVYIGDGFEEPVSFRKPDNNHIFVRSKIVNL